MRPFPSRFQTTARGEVNPSSWLEGRPSGGGGGTCATECVCVQYKDDDRKIRKKKKKDMKTKRERIVNIPPGQMSSISRIKGPIFNCKSFYFYFVQSLQVGCSEMTSLSGSFLASV